MNAPLVSIVLPTYNRLAFLPATLASIFAQTMSDWELIIADDGSNAATRAFLHAVARRERVRLRCLGRRANPAATRNAALQVARGELVAFIDSDDLWRADKLQVAVTALQAQPSCQWCYSSFEILDQTRAGTSVRRAGARALLQGWLLQALLEMRLVVATPTVLVRRALLQRLGGFDELLLMFEDYELWLRLAMHSEALAIDVPLVTVRRHRAHSGTDVLAYEGQCQALQKLLAGRPAPRLRRIIRHQRARASAGLARSQAVAQLRGAALHTLLASSLHSWPYPAWWREAPPTLLRALAPALLRRWYRRYRERSARA